jgi:hypothetical protein
MQASDQRHQAVTAVPDTVRLPSGQPTPLLLVESAEQYVQLAMQRLVGMASWLQAVGTLALMNRGRLHFAVSSGQNLCS